MKNKAMGKKIIKICIYVILLIWFIHMLFGYIVFLNTAS